MSLENINDLTHGQQALCDGEGGHRHPCYAAS
jgi:hypothetical protein